MVRSISSNEFAWCVVADQTVNRNQVSSSENAMQYIFNCYR